MSINRKQSLAATSMTAGLFVLLAAGYARAAEYYVAPDGGDSNRGTMDQPFATLSKANGAAAAGDTIWVRGGIYYITTQLVLSRGGTSDTNRTKIWAYPGEKPVLDASRYNTSNRAVDVPVVLVTGSWMHLRGLEIANAKVGRSGDHSYSLLRTKNSSNNVFELLHLHHAFGPALFIDTGNGGNLILNCDAHDNYDQDGSQGDGQNGDGFGVHYQTTGPSTIIRGCRAWNNSDDGYDYISQEVPVITEGSFAMSNGRGSQGNGNGFKVGSSKTGIRHVVRNNVAWKNKAAGFYANHSSGGNTWLNNTAYNNGTQYNMLASPPNDSGQAIILTGELAHRMRNNVGFPNKNSNMGGADAAFNTWDLNITEASAAFESTSDAGCTGPREADGSIPSACAFMKLKAGSALIDKGTDVRLPFVGSAPDLGAYEFGAEPTEGTGGGAAGGSGTGMGGTAANGSGGDGAGGTVGTSGGMGAQGGAGQGGVVGIGGSPETGGATGGTDGDSGGRAGAAGASEDDSSAAGCACAVTSDDATAGRGGFAFLALASAFAARSRDRRTARRKNGRSSRF
ncbi:right-handed parallel beta-helix repeat-containing protein [Sorangium atrum]|uniref:Right-handed parallel beta-helix repeat-containing protein n=1 Tax=Sorangium atrum TaxID=2995308 RepID=A0ABT5C9A5_9BACT|nr:right-handed parallel beta-helix repeat-containing protein [Sorangium aterium]MDC0683025.1 right-handed parallel beta-helix repeat-containing protein [Sorangium aterium]